MPAKPAARPQVVVVTGAAAGVGRAVALRFARAGAWLGLIARDAAALAALEDEIEQAGGRALSAPVDVADAAAVRGAAERFAAAFGAIDLWVNDAMVTVFAPVSGIAPAEFRRVTEVTYLGAVHGTMAALAQMRPRDRGHIIIIGSALAYRGIPLQSAYCGAKHALRGFTDSLRCELAHERSGIRVTIVELPAMNTPQFSWARTHMPNRPRPMGTIYQPEVAAEAVWRAVRRRPREYWVGFSTLKTIVGTMIVPGYLDGFLGRVAFEGQETGEPVAPNRRDNLEAPVTALHATHGAFGAVAKARGLILSGSVMRLAIVAGGAVLCFVLGGLVF
jgi:NAD(P)-dependent dehydrogenase (short-subunit alcohol dehydrogenase family)